MTPTPPSPPSFWQVEVTLPREALPPLDAALDSFASSISWVEVDEGADVWMFQALFDDRPSDAFLRPIVALAAASVGVAEPEIRVERLEGRDWLAQTKIAFPPLDVGRFFIHGCHFEGRPPAASHCLCIDAATAFGSGYHQSTFGCLTALDRLARRRSKPKRALDVGCGSGILAMAGARAWRRPFLAVDIDPESVRVARLNVRNNGLRTYVQVEQGVGVNGRESRKRGPYSLILANILARPLCAMSAPLSRLVAPGGRVVLAGLLNRQARQVANAYRRQGLPLERRFVVGAWSTLVVRRPWGEHRR